MQLAIGDSNWEYLRSLVSLTYATVWPSVSRMTDAVHCGVEAANTSAIDATLGSKQRVLHPTDDIFSWTSIIRISALSHLTNVKVVQLDNNKHKTVNSQYDNHDCY